jgi:hypothetical protein
MNKMKKLRDGHIYYMVYFDGMLNNGGKAPKEIIDMFDSDVAFKLNDFNKCMDYVNKLSKHNCDYGFYVEVWNEEDESVKHPVTFRWLEF